MAAHLPHAWVSVPLRDVVLTRKGKKPERQFPDQTPGTLPYITIEAFESGIPKIFTDDKNAPQCAPNDVLLVWDGARAGLCGTGMNGVIGSTIMALTPVEIDPSYLYWFVRSKYFEFNTRVRGTGTPHLDPTVVWPTLIPIAPLAEQYRISKTLKRVHSRAKEVRTSLLQTQQLMRRFRQSVLSRAFRGELTERDPKDDPAGMILRRIEQQKVAGWESENRRRLSKNKNNGKPRFSTTREEFGRIPAGWTWTSLSSLAEVK